jgi:DNA replication protein
MSGDRHNLDRVEPRVPAMRFNGFSTDNLVGLPPELFSEVVPAIVLPSELKVTLHVFYRLSRLRGTPRRLSWDDLINDRILQRSLRSLSKLRPIDDMLAEGLDAALNRGTLLHLSMPEGGRTRNWYLVHTEANRAWLEQTALVGTLDGVVEGLPELERPTLVSLYEQNIGLVTPMLIDELREAEERFPRDWIEAAMREAVRANARSWRYIYKVLERWAAHGRTDAANRAERPIDFDRYTNGQYGHLFRRGSDESDL